MAKLANVAVSEAVGVITLGVRVSPRAQKKKPLKDATFKGFRFFTKKIKGLEDGNGERKITFLNPISLINPFYFFGFGGLLSRPPPDWLPVVLGNPAFPMLFFV